MLEVLLRDYTWTRIRTASICRVHWQLQLVLVGTGLEVGTLQVLSWSRWQDALLQLYDGASPRLKVNYTDRNQDSEGNMPGFQRGCYQDGSEQQPRDHTPLSLYTSSL